MPTVHLIIKGKVQGVFYRATAKKIAEENGITGLVRNTPDDAVEIVASGSQSALQTFVEWCKKGPARANVNEVKTKEVTDEMFTEFVIKR